MKKPKSAPVFNDQDFPICITRLCTLSGTGIDVQEAAEKPIIAVVNSQTDINPGHTHLSELAVRVKEGIHAAGGIPFEFNVPAACDGLSEGHAGMRFILPQRELIADMVETHVRSMGYDGMVMISSCDKINPGMLMAAARLDIATVFLTGGSSAWQIRFHAGRTGSVDHKDYPDPFLKMATATPATCGACEIMGTANTFQSLAEALGMTIPGSSTVPAFHVEKQRCARAAGKRIVDMVEEELTARKILTREALLNALMVDLAIGGSTNAALHLPALAHELGHELSLGTFNQYNQKIPTLCGITPNGPHGMIDLYTAGGIPAVMKVLQDDLHLDCLNATGKTWSETLSEVAVQDEKVIRPREAPFSPEGGTVALFGNLAPDGAVIKQSAVVEEMRVYTGPAKVMESEEQALEALRESEIQEGQVVIIRNEGPKGGPGMPETLAVTMALDVAGLKKVALITDGRFSGASYGPCIGHVSPEAYVGGPLAAVRDGDQITIDIPGRKLSVDLTVQEIKKRLEGFRPQQREIPPGYLRRYVAQVKSAALGATLD
jgi:dihydroxy-acid dehydratase